MNANFEKMCRRTGGYSLPWLVRLSNEAGDVNLHFVNDTQARTYGGNTYAASAFDYTPNEDQSGFGGGGTLSIETASNNSIIQMIESYYGIRLQVIGVLLDDGTVSEIKTFQHHYGSAKWNGKQADFTFERDDRLDMTFPALVFSHYNNRGNA